MGCEIKKEQRKCIGIGEAVLGFILLAMVFVTCGSYWTYVYWYKESHCDSRHYIHSEKYRKEPEEYNMCLLTTEIKGSKMQCQFFDVDGQTLPNSVGVQAIVGLSVSIFIGALGIRAKTRLTSYGFTNDTLGDSASTDESKSTMAKYDFWTINLMLTTMLVGMFGFSHLYCLKYTDICIESSIDDYNGDEIVTNGKTIFYVLLVLVGIYNYLWYHCINNKYCCCCSCPQYVYWIINMLMSVSMMIYIYTLSKMQVGLPIVFTIYVIAYFIYVGLFIREFEYNSKSESKEGSKICPEDVKGNNGGAMAVNYPVQPVGSTPVDKAQLTNQYYAGNQPGQYFPGWYVVQPNNGGQPAGGYAPQPYAQPAPGYEQPATGQSPTGYPPQQDPVAPPPELKEINQLPRKDDQIRG